MGLKKYLTKEFAVLKDDHGVTISTVKINRGEYKFTYKYNNKKRSYNVIRDNIYFHENRGLFIFKRFYFYNINNTDPLSFNKGNSKWEPLVRPDLYHKLLECEVLIKLNTVNKSIFDNIKPIHIIIGLVLLGAGMYYFYTQNHQVAATAINTTMNMTTNVTKVIIK